MDKIQLTATLLTAASRVMTKNNEGKSQYVMHSAEITGPETINDQPNPFLGKTVGCANTIRNAKGDVKEIRHKGDEVTLYAELVGDTVLFEIGSERVETAAKEELVGLFQSVKAGQTV